MTVLRNIVRPVVRGVVNALNSRLVGGVSISYSDEYQAVLDEMTTVPSDDVAEAQNIMVEGLVEDGVWDNIIWWSFVCQETNDDGEAQINWKNVNENITLVNAPTFTSLEGFTGDGSTSYIDFEKSFSEMDGFSQDDAGFGGYVRESSLASASETLMGVYSTPGLDKRSYIQPRLSNGIFYSINDSSTFNVSNFSTDGGMFAVFRDGANNVRVYKNTTKEVDSDSQDSSGVPPLDVFALGRSVNGGLNSPASFQVSLLFISNGLSETHYQNLFTRFETYMDTVEKGVVS